MADRGKHDQIEAILPHRYRTDGKDDFDRACRDELRTATSILDLGAGRHPIIPEYKRPSGVDYVGLDLSEEELGAAEPGAYTETFVADATERVEQLEERFDLIVSWQVLEHVSDLRATANNVRLYLKPGGLFLAQFSGSRAVFSIANRLLPNRAGSRLVDLIMKRSENNQPVFPAYYDSCHPKGIEHAFSSWTSLSIAPIYRAAYYFQFSVPLMRLYLLYENAIASRPIAGLATHFLIKARR